MNKITPYYKCLECGDIHDFRHEAEKCCPRDAERIYLCECGDYFSGKTEAETHKHTEAK